MTKTREPVPEAAWVSIFIPAAASSLVRTLLDGDLASYAGNALLCVAAPAALVLLVRSARSGVGSWSWALITLASVALGLATALT
ncbi:hypothetical protein ACFQY7_30825 [Actinomadura luteofluorescens]|uniref:Uncharacterized protein n=1 Tax=Actinomadura luteofluorescens TaxID=46163 RepID=A0A7Y9EL26_9ACTN|nr:hypothetical protein [Actinomadura luteofluorescens]NYD49729.1 hypothetical protein [Actinomadura luteofluorescens]